jgi:hypothetical protein
MTSLPPAPGSGVVRFGGVAPRSNRRKSHAAAGAREPNHHGAVLSSRATVSASPRASAVAVAAAGGIQSAPPQQQTPPSEPRRAGAASPLEARKRVAPSVMSPRRSALLVAGARGQWTTMIHDADAEVRNIMTPGPGRRNGPEGDEDEDEDEGEDGGGEPLERSVLDQALDLTQSMNAQGGRGTLDGDLQGEERRLLDASRRRQEKAERQLRKIVKVRLVAEQRR